ncbi:putative bifunctional diguanylate cyclase/phosphodiesterase [Thiomicrorhabdus lithotrophica]|uniref:EAL domain-containing protein n=1 Tax=Thiomicrorhabdus lithotrophica TaxID=2949997 RepID=A0ABY8C938_9GAMM|nr:EAL domain-containing protein [Thiomicrorhabdus lithotrophica]WEJ62484.1 EAL domain-containing protein [Thiomicrorhabdus lithotrophica]
MPTDKNNKNFLDSLTQMPNRAGWLAMAEEALEKNSANKAVLFIDLDRFKWVNDSLGHDAGDELLQLVSESIKSVLQEPSVNLNNSVSINIPGRMGGDEFVALLQGVESVVQVEEVANRIVDVISQPISLKEAEVEIGASIGVASYPQDSKNLNDLLKYADLAMYRAKHSGRNQVVFYQPEMIRQIEFRRDKQFAIRKALKEGSLSLDFQPIHDYKQQEIIAIEAILNLENSPSLSALDYAEVFSIADESQVAIQLSEWMIEEGLEFIQRLDKSELNISLVTPVRPSHFHQKTFADWLAERLESYELTPENLVLSLNDTCLNVQRFPVEKQLKALSKLGVEVAVQSFGSGNLSPLRLHDWPIDRLHLSSMFVTEITQKRSMESMAIALIQMGLTLNKQVIAYGVRTAEQQAFLSSHQCNLMQGPYFGEPLTAAEMELLLINDMEGDSDRTQFLDEFADDY